MNFARIKMFVIHNQQGKHILGKKKKAEMKHSVISISVFDEKREIHFTHNKIVILENDTNKLHSH